MINFVFSPRNNDKTTPNNETNKKTLISTTITINFVISEYLHLPSIFPIKCVVGLGALMRA